MTRTAHHLYNDARVERCRLDRRGLRNWPRQRLGRSITVTAALLGLVLVAAACGGSKSPGGASAAAGAASSVAFAKFLAFSRCVRSHGISDFPDPTTSPGGAVAIQTQGGPGSDFDPNIPRLEAAKQACQPLLPSGSGTPQQSTPKIAAKVKWAH